MQGSTESIYVPECFDSRNAAKGAYSAINKKLEQATNIEEQLSSLIKLIPSVADKYDALGKNTKLNIDEFVKIIKDMNETIKSINSGGETGTAYYQTAETKDERITSSRRAAANASQGQTDIVN